MHFRNLCSLLIVLIIATDSDKRVDKEKSKNPIEYRILAI